MRNPFGDQQIPGSYDNLHERVYKKVSADVHDLIREIVVKAYESALMKKTSSCPAPKEIACFPRS